MEEGGVHHVLEFVLVLRVHVDEVGNAAEIADVEEAVVGGAVVAGEAAAVHTEDDGEILQGNVVDDLVEGALEEGAVDGAEGAEAFGGHAGGEENSVFFGDTYVEVALGVVRPEEIERGAVGHGGGDGYDFVVGGGEFDQAFGENFRVGLFCGELDTIGGTTRERIIGTETVEFLLLLQGGLETPALLGEGVENYGLVLCFKELESFDEERKVVAVDGAVVVEAEFFKDHATADDALGGFFGFASDVAGGFATELFEEAGDAVVDRDVGGVCGNFVEILGNGAYVFVDGPLIVVEDDDEALGLGGDVVEGFVADAVGEGGVAGQDHDVFVAAGHVTGYGHAESGGESGAGVACAEAVVFAFGAEHEAVEALGLADGIEEVLAAGEELVDVALVRDVEDEMVLGGVEDVVHGEGELDNAEIGADVASGFGYAADEALANLFGEALEFDGA